LINQELQLLHQSRKVAARGWITA